MNPALPTFDRLRCLRIAVAAAYLLGMLISWRLWFGFGRTFPRAPVLIELPNFIPAHDYVLSLILFAALALTLISGRRFFLITTVVAMILLVIIDINRLQPWVFQYCILLALLTCATYAKRDSNSLKSVCSASQLVLCSLYFWSGVQKLNWSFGHEVMPRLFESAGIQLSPAFVSWLPALGIVLALFEMMIGVGLFLRRTRAVALIAALLMHLILLIVLVASGRNLVVWPWNLSLMFMIMLLFWRSQDSLVRPALGDWRGEFDSYLPKAIFLLCTILPVLSFAGWWDLYLSAALYAGNAPVAVMRFDDTLRQSLSPASQRVVFSTERGDMILPFFEWSMEELNVPNYPATRVYRQLARKLCAAAGQTNEAELVVRERPSLISGRYEVTRTKCADLKQ